MVCGVETKKDEAKVAVVLDGHSCGEIETVFVLLVGNCRYKSFYTLVALINYLGFVEGEGLCIVPEAF